MTTVSPITTRIVRDVHYALVPLGDTIYLLDMLNGTVFAVDNLSLFVLLHCESPTSMEAIHEASRCLLQGTPDSESRTDLCIKYLVDQGILMKAE